MHLPDPKGMLVLWCAQRGLAPPVFVASKVPGGVEVLGSLKLGGERYMRAHHIASHESDAELEVSRELFVQVQATSGPLGLGRDGTSSCRDETPEERSTRIATESARYRQTQRQTLDREAQRRGAFVCITTHHVRVAGKLLHVAHGLLQRGRTQLEAGPFRGHREGVEAQVVAELLRLCTEMPV